MRRTRRSQPIVLSQERNKGNSMKGLFNLFKRKPKESAEANRKLLEGGLVFEHGKSHYLAHRDQEAVNCFDKAIECGLEDAELFETRGSCLQSLEWHLDAIDDFTRAISLEPDDCNLYFQRAISKTASGDQLGFEADIQQAICLSK